MTNDAGSVLVALASGKLALDVFGPSAKLAGKELKKYTSAGFDHLREIFERAEKRRKELRLRPGKISPRVLPVLARTSSAADDEVMRAYYAGVLCSSISQTSRDDRAVGFIRLIEGLSTYALRAHCIVYASVAMQQSHKMSDVRKWLMRGQGITIAFDEQQFRRRMKFGRGENQSAMLEHAFVSLASNDLCMQGLNPSIGANGKGPYRWTHITVRGAELFCWANGFGQNGVGELFESRKLSDEVRRVALKPLRFELGLVSYPTP